MTGAPREVVYDGDQLFRVEHQIVDGRLLPYEFVHRVGAVTVMPIVHQPDEEPHVLAIHNNRLYYGSSVGLPGGNLDGRFEAPEHPSAAAERELREETGFGYTSPSNRSIDTFLLRELSSTINYPRYFSIMRNVQYMGGEDDNPNEVVTPQPVPLGEYVEPLLKLQRGELYPEINAAFSKANIELGREAVIGWLAGHYSPNAAEVPQAFDPWLVPVTN